MDLDTLFRLPLWDTQRQDWAVDPLGGFVFATVDGTTALDPMSASRSTLVWSAGEDRSLRLTWRVRLDAALPDGVMLICQHPEAARLTWRRPAALVESTLDGGQRLCLLVRPQVGGRILEGTLTWPAQPHAHWDGVLRTDGVRWCDHALFLAWRLPRRRHVYVWPEPAPQQHIRRRVDLLSSPELAWSTSTDAAVAWRARAMRFRQHTQRPSDLLRGIFRDVVGAQSVVAAIHTLAAWLDEHFRPLEGGWPEARDPETLLRDGLGDGHDRAVLMGALLAAGGVVTDPVYVDGPLARADADGAERAFDFFRYPSLFGETGLYWAGGHRVIDPGMPDGLPRSWGGRAAVRVLPHGLPEPLRVPGMTEAA